MNLFNVGLVRGFPVSRTYKWDCCWVSYLIKLMKWLRAFMKRSAAMNSQRSYSETFNFFCWVWKVSRRHMSQMMSYTWITCFPEKFDYTSFFTILTSSVRSRRFGDPNRLGNDTEWCFFWCFQWMRNGNRYFPWQRTLWKPN